MVAVGAKCGDYMHWHQGIDSDYLCMEGTGGAVVAVVAALALNCCCDYRIDVARVVVVEKSYSCKGTDRAGSDCGDRAANDALFVSMLIH